MKCSRDLGESDGNVAVGLGVMVVVVVVTTGGMMRVVGGRGTVGAEGGIEDVVEVEGDGGDRAFR